MSTACVQRSPGRCSGRLSLLWGTWVDSASEIHLLGVVSFGVSSLTSAGFGALFSQGALQLIIGYL